MKHFLISLAVVAFLSAGSVASAQSEALNVKTSQFCQNGSCTYVPLEPLYGLPDCYGASTNQYCNNTSSSFSSLVTNGFRLLIGAGAVVAVVMIVLGALTYMFSDIVGHKTKALARIRGAMWAIVLLMSSYLILYTINPDLVNLTFVPTIERNYTVGTTGTTQTPLTRVPVFSDKTAIYNGPGAYDQLMDLQSRCESPKALRAVANGTDSTGGYVSYECTLP